MGALDGGSGVGLLCLSFCDGRGGWGQGAGRRTARDVAGRGGGEEGGREA
jgi:hypothetical protein